MSQSDQIKDLLESLAASDADERVTAIRVLGEVGDEDALQALRTRLAAVSREMRALVSAVGKLKRKLGVR